MDSVIANSTIATPYIIHFMGSQQFFVVAEKLLITEVDSFPQAMSALFACYYIFDISYPKECNTTMLFLERFMLGIVTGPKLPKTAVGTISDIQKIK